MNNLHYEQIKNKSRQEIQAMPLYQQARRIEIAILEAKGNEYQKLFDELFFKYFMLRLEHEYETGQNRNCAIRVNTLAEHLFDEMAKWNKKAQEDKKVTRA